MRAVSREMLKISILDISFKITKLISQPGTSCLINTAAVSYFMHKSIPANTTTQTDKNTLNCSLQYIRSFNSHITGYPYQFAYPLFCHSLCRVVFCKVTAASRNSQTVPPSRQGHQLRKRWRATAWCGKLKFPISSGWLTNGSLCHPDDIITFS